MGVMLAAMMVLVFSNVVLRYAFGTGIVWGEEISRLLFVWLVFLGAILALKNHQHLGLELLVARLSPQGRKLCAILSHSLMLYALYLFFMGSYVQTVIGLDIYSTVLRFSTALYAAAGLFPALVMAVIVLLNLVRILMSHPAAMIPGTPDHAAFGSDL
ncbi:TRAP transporter small permease [Elstera litoralis]|nr:TRAP transporter small permease [Elstera litoralis]